MESKLSRYMQPQQSYKILECHSVKPSWQLEQNFHMAQTIKMAFANSNPFKNLLEEYYRD